jgi:hypothetical protein
MAARRLVIVMLLMLGISTLAALLAPTVRRDGSATESTTTTRDEQTQPREPSGRLVRATIDASRRPRTVRIRAGDQLALVVRSKRPDGVEIPRLGELDDVDPVSPARFDLLPPAGRYVVRLVERGEPIGQIVVRSEGAKTESGEDPGRPAK